MVVVLLDADHCSWTGCRGVLLVNSVQGTQPEELGSTRPDSGTVRRLSWAATGRHLVSTLP